MEIATVLLKTTDIILKVMGPPLFKEILSIKDYEKETDRLVETIGFIRDLLIDTEGVRFHGNLTEVHAYNRLREAYLDAEDFMDEVVTRRKVQEAEDRKLKEAAKEIQTNAKGVKYVTSAAHNKIKSIANKTRGSLSFSTPIKVHKAIKEISSNLDAISEDLQKFGMRKHISMESTGTRTREMGSFVNTMSIIGRDKDKREIIELLIAASTHEGHIPVISIVGIGGMGKTTVARLVYDDKSQLESCKFDLRLWVSDSQKFNLKLLLQKILKSITPGDTIGSGIAELQNQLLWKITGKKFLLVLDDVENEDFRCWRELKDLLVFGQKGSTILVTTRSRRVAKVMCSEDSLTYELQGLSINDSWLLFEEWAFEGRKDEELVEIGKCIIQKCGRVPLAIKTIGSLLRGRPYSKWERVRDNDLVKIDDDCNDIIPILRVSFDALDSMSKECFRYCALFRKSETVSKEVLINIWMSNVCIKTNIGEQLEDVLEDVVQTLFDRCFLEEIGDTDLKMHDLMHDLAKEVAGTEMLGVDSVDVMLDLGTLKLEESIRHLTLTSHVQTVQQISRLKPKGRRLRTLLQHEIGYNSRECRLRFDKLVSDFPVLRMLDLQSLYIYSLPDSVGELKHLRWLDLSDNPLEVLPDSIGKLWNLQSLSLKFCRILKKLPKSIRKLMNLRHLDLYGCNALTSSPGGMGAMKSLRTLNIFIVGPSKSEHTARLEDLEPLSRLHGDLIIKLHETSVLKEHIGNKALLIQKRLRKLKILWSGFRINGLTVDDSRSRSDEDILTKLQPHCDLKKLKLDGYEGLRFPSWADDLASLLPNLVSITIDNSRGCQYLPSFSKLPCLTNLQIHNVPGVEFLEDNVPGEPFFTSLQRFTLANLPKLKGWCRDLAGVEEQSSLLPSFPHLVQLGICRCPNLEMTSMPSPSSPLKFRLMNGLKVNIGKDLRRWWKFPLVENNSVASSLSPSVSFSCALYTDALQLYFSTLCVQILRGNHTSFTIKGFNVFIMSLASRVEVHFRRMSKCLTSLKISKMPELKTFPKVLLHLTTLQELYLVSCHDFTGEEYEEDEQTLQHQPEFEEFQSLRRLSLDDLPNLVMLPKQIQSSTSLQVLDIHRCENLKVLPMDIQELINLKYMWLSDMPILEYIQDSNSAALSFPSLEGFWLKDLPNLRDCCREEQSLLSSFPCLSHIDIKGCPNLNGSSMLLSSVTDLFFDKCETPYSIQPSSPLPGRLSWLLRTDDVSLFTTALLEQNRRGLPLSVVIRNDDTEANSMNLEFERISRGLTSLQFLDCQSLKTLPELQHLTALQKLHIVGCGEFTGETPWEGLSSLTHLKFSDLPKMERLPTQIQFINSLQELDIHRCRNLKVFSAEILELINLKYLRLSDMPRLECIQESNSAALFFPSLESIWFRDLPNLKYWCRGLASDVKEEQSLVQPFPRLSRVDIKRCCNFRGNSMLLSHATVFFLDTYTTPCCTKYFHLRTDDFHNILIGTISWRQACICDDP